MSTGPRTRCRRRAPPVLFCAALLFGPAPVQATPLPNYLSQFVLMMDWVSRATVYVPRHAADADLASVAHAVAEVLVDKAQRLTPPDEFRDLHPHFLLVLENVERAFHWYAQGEAEKAERHLAVVRDETRLMRQIQREIGIEIPDLML
jgi:hypothetical protein